MLPSALPSTLPPIIVLTYTGPSLSIVLTLLLGVVVGLLGATAGVLTLPLVYRDGGWLLHRGPTGVTPDSAPVKHLGADAALGVPHFALLFGLAVGIDVQAVAGVRDPQWFEPPAANLLAVLVLAAGMLLASRLSASDGGQIAAVESPSALARRHLAAYLFALLAVGSAAVVALAENMVPGTDTVLLAVFALGGGAAAGVVVAALSALSAVGVLVLYAV